MKALDLMLAQPMVETLGWTLIHFLWQGTLVALLLANVLTLLQRRAANLRYFIACTAMLLMLILPLVTIWMIGSPSPKIAASRSPLTPIAMTELRPLAALAYPKIGSTVSVSASPTTSIWQERLSQRVSPWLPAMISVWLIGVLMFSLRLLTGWLYTQRLKKRGTRPLVERWQQVLRRLCDQLRITRPVRLCESVWVQVPTAIGWLRPVILLPASALTGLTAQQLEAIIAHELAHIRRYDYLVNLLQAVIETLFFYHPAVWWVSRRIRQEREHCCDDLAVGVCGDALVYARALIEMEQLRAATPQLAVAVNGGSLMNRIHRLVGVSTPSTNRFTGLLASIIVMIAVMIAVVSLGAGAPILLPSSSTSAAQPVVSAGGQEIKEKRLEAQADQTPRSAQDDRIAEALIPTLQDQSWEVRKSSVETLAKLGGSRAVELLIAALRDAHTQVREQAVIGLGARGDERLAEHLIAALTDRDWQVREQAAIALSQRRDARAVEALLTALTDREWQVQEQAARSLGAKGNERAVEPLINALQEQHQQVREAAAKSLGLIGDRRALEPLNRALQDADEQVRKKAAEALGRLNNSGEPGAGALSKTVGAPTPVTSDRIVNSQGTAAENLKALNSSNPAERAAAACALGRLGTIEAIPALINLLGDDTPIQPIKCWESGNWSPALETLKQASPGEQAAIALAALSRPAVNPLIAALNHGNASVRRNAAWAIGELTGVSTGARSDAVEPLVMALGDADPWVRLAAAFSLGELRPRRATEALIAALVDGQWNVREMAVRALGEMKTRAGVERLTAVLLQDGDERVRRKAAWALGEIKDQQALEALALALNDQNRGVRETAKWAIAEIRD